jgi:Fe2+ or Zn2+ uptake regulation protein
MAGDGVVELPFQITPEHIRGILSKHGYRLTAPREVIVDQAMLHDRPFTAEQLVTQLKSLSGSSGTCIGRATVYRTLEILASVDVLTRLIRPDGSPAYLLDAPGHRHHLVCSECGTTVAFMSCPINTLVQDLAANTKFTIHDHLLEVFGLCPACKPATTDR